MEAQKKPVHTKSIRGFFLFSSSSSSSSQSAKCEQCAEEEEKQTISAVRRKTQRGLYGHRRRVCTESSLWEKNPLPHWGFKPASVLRLVFSRTLYQLSYPGSTRNAKNTT